MRQLLEEYKRALKAKSTGMWRRFCEREQRDPEGCRAEAVMFWFPSTCGVAVKIYEDPTGGGPDFLCACRGGEFLLEATSLSAAAVAKATGISPDPQRGGGCFAPISRELCEKAISKTRQLSGHGKPTVLAITTEHFLGCALMDEFAARGLLVGRDYQVVIINDPARRRWVETDLRDSVFYNLGYPADHCRHDISAIVLVHITGSGLSLIGALNPGATFPFDPERLPSVPFFAVSRAPDADSPDIRLESPTPRKPYFVAFPGAE